MTSPRLSVIVPTYNRAPVVAKCLRALAGQTCPPEAFEVLVSDDGSSDGTRVVVEEAAGRGPVAVRYLHQPNSGANAARNRAIGAARGSLLLLINDDTIATPTLLAEHLAGHDGHPDDRVAVLGRVTVSPDLPPSRLAPLHLDRAFASLGDRRELDWRAFFTCNVSVKKSLLDRGGTFEERMRYHEDLELAQRLSRHGLRVVYRPEALGYHDHYLGEDEFLAVAAREARSLATWARIAPELTPMLGALGYEPALPRGRRFKHQLVRLAINGGTIPFWRRVARHAPAPLEPFARRLYDQIYQCVRRAHLRRELEAAPPVPPGPPRRFPGSMLLELRRGPLEFMTRVARRYGDVVHYRVGPQKLYLLNHPDHVKDVLVTHERAFVKGRGFERAKRLFGEGLLTSEGEFHLRQRRLAQPAFHKARVHAYGVVMAACAEKEIASWRDGRALDVHEAMRRTTMAIAGRTLFDADLAGEAEELGRALTEALRLFETVLWPFSELLDKLPLGRRRRFDAARARLDATVYRLIRERRAAGTDRGDFLSMLLQSQDTEGGTGGMTDEQIRDECMTIFLAGHETTANLLAWTWHLLWQNPECRTRVEAEVDAVVGGESAGADHYPRLAYVEKVLLESMRLYPPAWMIDRRVVEPYRVAGYTLPADSIVVVSPYVLHRDERLFPNPLAFDPERWTPEARAARPRYAYFPFGAGTRQCIGEAFAKMSAALVLATVARRWRLEAAPGHVVVPEPAVTLRPRRGLPMIARAREGR